MAAEKQQRSFGLSPDRISELTAEYEATKRLPNPYRTGAYAHAVTALITLGANKPHSLAKVHQAFKRAAGAEWYAAWAGQEKRNAETGLDAGGKFVQNLRVLQRTCDYGRKLLEVGTEVLKSKGAVIDLTRDSTGGLLVALNLDSDAAAKPGRYERARMPAAPKAAKGSGSSHGGRKGREAARTPIREAK
jgi:hypothetical protein